jgi:hypothetical protein
MAQQGKQMIVGACEGFAYHLVKLVLLANKNEYEVESITFFVKVVNPAMHKKYSPVSALILFDTQFYL